ncbi:hypothetical protein [Bradyrhizobium sp. AZCC 2289]|uniref:hypothetical protein n=1 Tax=Bradyrhizobium sp. AZCC 2289 TaxID=3117026 RepID=UPI002FF2C7A6
MLLESKSIVANASNHDRWGDRSAGRGCRRGCEMKITEASIATVRTTTQPPRIRMRLQKRMRAQMRM